MPVFVLVEKRDFEALFETCTVSGSDIAGINAKSCETKKVSRISVQQSDRSAKRSRTPSRKRENKTAKAKDEEKCEKGRRAAQWKPYNRAEHRAQHRADRYRNRFNARTDRAANRRHGTRTRSRTRTRTRSRTRTRTRSGSRETARADSTSPEKEVQRSVFENPGRSRRDWKKISYSSTESSVDSDTN